MKDVAYTLQYELLSSPPLRPPMAMPGVSRLTISSQHWRLKSRSRPPWIMQNRFWLSGFLCAAIQRSNHRTERFIASVIRSKSGDVVAITSSSCIIMSDPMEFCRDIECSGVSSLHLSDSSTVVWFGISYIGLPS
jgi:hypothetical protein